ncbi:MAG: universal stress protein [Dermatophilaceae bacterium]
MTETNTPRVVVGVDGSDQSKFALQWARYLAETMGSTLLAVSAWQPLTAYGASGIGWVVPPPDIDIEAAARASVDATLDEVFGDSKPAGMEVAVVAGNPAAVLLEMSQNARMLVVGSRGYGGFKGLLLGSVSSACAHHATCPVFIAHGDNPPPA